MNLLVQKSDGSVWTGGGAGVPWAVGTTANLLHHPPEGLIDAAAGSTRLIARSGWLVPDEEADDMPISWTAAARAGLDRALESMLPSVETRKLTLLIRPRVGDLLSDIPSTLTFLRRWNIPSVRLLLEPAALLADSMVARAEEHLQRIGETLGEHDATAAILLTNPYEAAGGPTGAMRCGPMHRGLIAPRMLAEFGKAALTLGKAVVLLEESWSEQAGLLA